MRFTILAFFACLTVTGFGQSAAPLPPNGNGFVPPPAGSARWWSGYPQAIPGPPRRFAFNPQMPGVLVARNAAPELRPFRVPHATAEPIPTEWPDLKIEKLPTEWPNLKLLPVNGNSPTQTRQPRFK